MKIRKYFKKHSRKILLILQEMRKSHVLIILSKIGTFFYASVSFTQLAIVIFTMSKFSRSAQLWLQQLQESKKTPDKYQAFINRMRERFVNQDQNRVNLSKLSSIKYSSNLTNYIWKCRVLLSQCGKQSLNDSILFLSNGLPYNLSKDIWN
jgi:Retrotransposon gag protein